MSDRTVFEVIDVGGVEWRPVLLDTSKKEGREGLESLVGSGRVQARYDTVRLQVRDLIAARFAAHKFDSPEIGRRVEEHLRGVLPEQYGIWVFYPWSGRLVHVLPEDEYREVRSDRNRYLITGEEQKRLRSFKIGIIGQSVGHEIAVALLLEGIGGEYRLADFDYLCPSNMNRLRTGLHNVGVNKSVVTAREMFEIDPFINVKAFTEGVFEENLDEFLTGGGRLDLLIEECDDLFVKVRAREKARERGIPVIMETCLRGMIDVERFDEDPTRPPFHGLAGRLRAGALKGLETKDKVPYVLRILGEDNLSDRFIASLIEIGETLQTWPQLASEVMLGGALTANVSRRLLLGEFTASGRFFTDMEKTVRDDAGAGAVVGRGDKRKDAESPREEASVFAASRLRASALNPLAVVGAEAGAGEPTREAVREIVHLGTMAPSGGNCQPWKFVFKGGGLLCLHDVQRSGSFLDFRHFATHLAFGAAVENMSIAALGMGLRADVRLFPAPPAHPEAICELRFSPAEEGPGQEDLLPQIPRRATNRRLGNGAPLDDRDRLALTAAASVPGAGLHLLTKREELEEMGDILGAGDRLRFLHKTMHKEMMSELRWTPGEAAETRDGLDIATLELSAADLAGMRIISKWAGMVMVDKVGGGRALEKVSKKAARFSSAVGLITVDGDGPEEYFKGGRILERVWLVAAARGLSFQPLTAITYLFARLERGGGEGLSDRQKELLAGLRRRYLELLPVRSGQAEVMLFCVGYADPPSARSLRRRVDDVLSFE